MILEGPHPSPLQLQWGVSVYEINAQKCLWAIPFPLKVQYFLPWIHFSFLPLLL